MGTAYRQSDDFKLSDSRPKVVVGVLIYNSEGKIFLATGEKFKNKWVLIGGHVEFGETLEDAVKKEAKEETNLVVENVEFITYIESVGSKEFTMKKHFIFLNFSVLAKEIQNIKICNELSDFKWIDPKEALEALDLNSSTRTTIEKFLEKN